MKEDLLKKKFKVIQCIIGFIRNMFRIYDVSEERIIATAKKLINNQDINYSKIQVMKH